MENLRKMEKMKIADSLVSIGKCKIISFVCLIRALFCAKQFCHSTQPLL